MKADWRIGRGWSRVELQKHLQSLETAPRNFDADPAELEGLAGWYTYGSQSVLGAARPGPPRPNGPFDRACAAMKAYEFSDRRIVRAFFDEGAELLNRTMLLEIKAFRVLRYLVGVRVGAVQTAHTDTESVFGFRYETLDGHIERGSEWFILRKEHASGTIHFRISAFWKPGEFPNWWSRAGFYAVGEHYQKKWHHEAHEYLGRIVREAAARMADEPVSHIPPPKIIYEKRTLNV